MLTEQGEIIHGWSEKWNAENRKLQNAAKRVNKFRDIQERAYKGIAVKETESGETVITISLTAEDIKKAPKTVKRIFSDLKLKETDHASLQLTLPEDRNYFQLAVMPDPETGRAGIRISSTPKQGEILVFDRARSELEAIPLFEAAPKPAATDLNNLIFAYRGISGNVDGNEIFVRTHPYIRKTMTAASRWVKKIIKERRKTSPPPTYHYSFVNGTIKRQPDTGP